jgi:hypothetical protein
VADGESEPRESAPSPEAAGSAVAAEQEPPRSPAAGLDPAQSRRVTAVVVGQNAATVGDSLLLIFVPLMVLGLTHSAIQVAVAYVATQAPALAAAYATVPRRWLPSKTLLVLYDAARCALMLAIAAVLALGSARADLLWVYVLLAVTSLLSGWFRPTRISFIAELVAPGARTRFNSLDRTFEALATAGGTAFAGFAYEFLPLSVAFLLNAVTFLASAVLMAGYGPAARASRAQDGPRPRFRSSVRVFARDRVTRGLVGGEALTGIAIGVYGTIFVIYVREGLRAGGAAFGLLETLQAVVAMGMGLIMAARRWRVRTGMSAYLGYAGMAAALIVLGVTRALSVTAAAMVLLGAGNMLYAVAVRSLLQSRGSGDQLVQLFALESILSRCAQVAGAAVAGVLVTAAVLSPAGSLAVAGAIILLVAGIAFRVAGRAA